MTRDMQLKCVVLENISGNADSQGVQWNMVVHKPELHFS